ncbi:hypothetical protein JCM6882_008785 [Rhodosporidiobolus microsporus]
MDLRQTLAGDRPLFMKSARRPSAEPLLPSLANSLANSSRGPKSRWGKTLAAAVATYWVVTLARTFGPGRNEETALFSFGGGECGRRGLAPPASSPDDEQHRVVVRLRPPTDNGDAARNPENTVLPQFFHPSLTTDLPRLFDSTAYPFSFPHTSRKCVTPHSHTLPLRSPLLPSLDDPELFFSVSTTPSRATSSAPVWQHFMSSPSSDRPPPGCLVTDGHGQGDGEGMAGANAAFREHGLGCTMRDSSRAGDRYEMRVLTLIKDAWQESERRRVQDGAPLVEWFVFQDDDTWWSDPQMLRALLSGYDSRDDYIFGSFSESRGNFGMFGKIAYGGAGMMISRSLVGKMQQTLDVCVERFAHVFGGDGLISECAAFTRGVGVNEVVSEVPGMRQMDMLGDVTGYLTAGTAPFLTLHHWTSWLSLIPSISGADAISLLSRASSAIGGPNLFRRWIFDDGAVVLTLGYAVTLHREKLNAEALTKTEWTWDQHEPRAATRPKLEEGEEKLTYYLTSVEPLSPTVTLLRHTCTHPTVQAGLRSIDVLYDTRAEGEPKSWLDRVLGRPLGEAKPSARGVVKRAAEGGAKDVEGKRQRELAALREKKAKRVVKFSG